MKNKISLSIISSIENFDVEAAKHAHELKSWKSHQERVELDLKNPPKDPMLMHWPLKKPRAHPSIEAAIDDNGEVNFEPVDDTPKPEKLSLGHKKIQLHQRISDAHIAAVNVVLPLGKHKLFAMRENAIAGRDEERKIKLVEKNRGFFKKLTSRLMTSDEITQAIIDSRPPEDAAFLAEQKPRHEKIAIINQISAQALHDVEDLTEDTVDSWKLPDFPK